MEIFKISNLTVRFLLELCLLASLGYWGFHTGQSKLIGVMLGIGTPLLAAVIWGTFLSPKAAIAIPDSLQLIMEIALFGLAAAALYTAGQPVLSIVFVAVAAINRFFKI